MSAPVNTTESGSFYRNYVLVMLLIVYFFSLVDRQIISVLIEPIRLELGLSDTQIGLLSGLAFGLLYATTAIPLARIGDRWSRRNLIAICLAFWSIATALCGAAGSFLQLFAGRVAVGTGEAGAGPSSQSMLADYFPPHRRATAFGIYSTGVFAGAGAGLALGGWLSGLFGWRGALVAVALPGLAFSLLFWLTVREPPRGRFEGLAGHEKSPPFGESLRLFWRTRALVWASLGLGFSGFAMQSLLNWMPAFLSRFHGMSPAEAGGTIGPVVALGGTAGVLAGGLVSDWVGRRDRRNVPRVAALASFLSVPAAITALAIGEGALMFALLGVTFFMTAFIAPPTLGLIQNLAPPTLRAFSAAMAGFISIILGSALAPFLTGVASDLFAAAGFEGSLRWGLITSIAISGLGGFAYLNVARHLGEAEKRGV